MLQKSKSKTISKFKFLVLLPLMLVMLTYVACSDDANPNHNVEEKSSTQEILIEVENFSSFTEEENAAIQAAAEELHSTSGVSSIKITDGNKTITMSGNAETGKVDVITVDKNGEENKKAPKREYAEGADVPFAVIEQVPVFPGCENLGSNEEQKKCMTGKIAEFVSEKFDSSLGEKLGLTGVNRVIVVFKISPGGEITDVRARAAHPDLEVEAKRVIEQLPQMEPGKHNGKAVAVSYSLPIVFQVGE